MPTLVSDTIRLAFRKLGAIRAGQEVSSSDAADALASLTSLYSEWISAGTFGRVYNIPLMQETELTATANMHYNAVTDEAITITLPSTMAACDCCTWNYRDYGWCLPEGYWDGVNVPPDLTVMMVTDSYGVARATYVYDAYVQLWMRVDTILLTDEAPLSGRGADGLASKLAIRLTDQYGEELLTRITISSAASYQMALVSKYGQAEPCGASCGPSAASTTTQGTSFNFAAYFTGQLEPN